ncbi:hypothetical protein PHMEG_00019153 [Phytophthora megakarya]|uniref:RNase H type-1 domain-containing protein n=1 Tax=Phytophthora megakarya TaxID=4795 RepID=A0A225VUU3_9STRA|nr:hypothetical protein PHMEG_00019153 [Phytophthora megakarya]
MLRHPDIQKPFVIIPHANRWAACAVVGQEYDARIQPVQKDEDGLAAIMGVGITPREHLDEAVETLIPLKGLVRRPPVMSLPGWKVLKAKGFLLENVTVNDAEYWGLLKGLEMAIEMKLRDLVAVGDSRIVIQQVQGLINCNQPHLQKHLAKVEVLKKEFGSLRLLHLEREYNQAADYLTTKTLVLDESLEVTDPTEIAHLEQVSKIAEQLMKVEDSRVLAAVTRSRSQAESASRDRPMNPLEFQAERWRRIRGHQDADEYLSEIKDFLKEDFEKFSPRRLRKVAKVADLFVLDTRDVLYRLARSTRDRPRDFQDEPRLVVPKALRNDVLYYGHENFQGGHQGIPRTRICAQNSIGLACTRM